MEFAPIWISPLVIWFSINKNAMECNGICSVSIIIIIIIIIIKHTF